MASIPIPGNVFENLFEIQKELKKERVVFSEKKPLSLSLFSLDFQWILEACKTAKREKRKVSYSEFEEIKEEGLTHKSVQGILVEIISEGKYCVLLVNTCPVAQLDFRGNMGLAEFFELPPMDEEQWDLWELLGASTIHFEIDVVEGQVFLMQVKKEEGMVNALKMKRTIDLFSSENRLSVYTPKTTLSAEPTMENLSYWVEVRAGRCNPVVLKHL